MGKLDSEILSERIAAIHRHLNRVENRLPATPDQFYYGSDESDAVILHLWQ
ncbi:MAG: hypothetical protein LW832_06640 [Parachlamydia sp.]|jgi:hypothetical protein|nr:hypothetical protein [Parachlamydia sp.]